ncbi:MAG TPA: hypothetical protein VL996_10685 [Methylocella sp.]|nr:hypothetical protein [Methylocella sp.]
MARLTGLRGGIAFLSGLLLLAGCGQSPPSQSEPPPPVSQVGQPPAPQAAKSDQGMSDQLADKGPLADEAQRAGRDAASFPQADEDYFHDMDNGVALSPEEIKGRNMWLVWTGGNDRQWDTLATSSTLGYHDLLKVVTSHPSQNYCYGPCNRDSRWHWLGAVNEPCFEKPTGPDPDRFGLWLDVRRKDCPPDPFENEAKYPGVKIGARGQPIGGGKSLPVGSYFGYASGIVGLRLFPNPDFDEKAAKNWDPERYYTDPDYYNDPKLVRPYRVGMSCAMCHVSPSPIHPPADPAHPEWSNLSSTVGAQYLWFGRLFAYRADLKDFGHQVTNTYAPGTTETSLVSTDYIINPRSNNPIYNLGARLAVAHHWGKETLEGGELNNKQLPGFFDPPNTAWAPRILKDGSDSVGALGALNRVYVNIGLYSEDWFTHFNPVFGGKAISPFPIKNAEDNSAYFRATEAGTPYIAKFFLKAGQPDRLKDAPGGDKYLTADEATLNRGKIVFAETCARCHSSKLPESAWKALDPGGCSGPDYLKCWKRYWDLTKTDGFKADMRAIVAKPDFLDNNYLSTDARIPVTLLRTNACSPLATNAIRGNIWDNFSSSTYKDLPSVGAITLQDPFTGDHWQYKMPGGGLGFTRVPSLISEWANAPFLINKRIGPFDENPSVESRVKSFEASIEQLLWPEKRPADPGLEGFVLRTTERSSVKIPKRQIPPELSHLFGSLPEPFPALLKDPITRLFDKDGNFEIGPFPKGFPIYLINYQPLVDIQDAAGKAEHLKNFTVLLGTLAANLPPPGATASDEEILAFVQKLRGPLLKLSKCPDFVVNKGHYFGTAKFNETEGLSEDEKAFGPEPALSDDDKRALIEFIKTF